MRQTFVKAALVASCMATVACKQAPTEMGPGQYPVMTIATTDRTIPSNYSAKICRRFYNGLHSRGPGSGKK